MLNTRGRRCFLPSSTAINAPLMPPAPTTFHAASINAIGNMAQPLPREKTALAPTVLPACRKLPMQRFDFSDKNTQLIFRHRA